MKIAKYGSKVSVGKIDWHIVVGYPLRPKWAKTLFILPTITILSPKLLCGACVYLKTQLILKRWILFDIYNIIILYNIIQYKIIVYYSIL